MSGKRGNPNWVKGGESPNPGGRSKAATELRHALECLADDAGKRLGGLLHSEDEKIALEAAKFVIDHVKGKATQAITGADDEPLIPTASGLIDLVKGIVNTQK